MKQGLYEQVLDTRLEEESQSFEHKSTRNIDNSELPRTISTAYQKIIRDSLAHMDKEEDRINLMKNNNNHFTT